MLIEGGRKRESEVIVKLSVDNTIDMTYADAQISKQLSDDNWQIRAEYQMHVGYSDRSVNNLQHFLLFSISARFR